MAAPMIRVICRLASSKSKPLTASKRHVLELNRIKQTFYQLRKKSTLSRSIQSIFNAEKTEQHVSVKGWVKAVRWHKKLQFLQICDGSGPKQLQVVIPDTVFTGEEVTFGSCVEAEGKLVESLGKGQTLELLAESVKVIGNCDPNDFPIKQRTRHAPQYLRDFLHVRPKTNTFGSLLRIRNEVSMAVHKFFQDNDYVFIHTPILTSSDCEGACEVFQVEPLRSDLGPPSADDWGSEGETDDDISKGAPPPHQGGENLEKEDPNASLFFRQPTYLTVSGQLHLEVMTGAMTKVYNFGPTFRAENSVGSFHLSEFYMVEAELAFTEGLEDIMRVMEDLVKSTYTQVIEKRSQDMVKFTSYMAPPEFAKNVDTMMTQDFKRISYTEAIELLKKSGQNFKYDAQWGCDLKKEHELYITRALGNVPVFVVDYPAEIKPFYARRNPDSKTVAAVDLLLPGVGELCGGSLREERPDVLEAIMKEQGLMEQIPWYLDLRKYGTCPHGGFGLGFERLLVAITGAQSLKDVIPFPRWPGRCKL